MPNLLYISAQMGGPYEIDGPSIFTQLALPLRANRWSYDVSKNALTGISREAVETECSLHFTDALAFDNTIQAFDADIQAGTPGTLVYNGEWEQPAYIVGWKADEVFENGVSGNATFVLLEGVWRKFTRFTLERGSGSAVTLEGIDMDAPTGEGELDLGFDFPGRSTPPTITLNPQSVTVGATEPAYFEVDALGYHLSYQWQIQSGGAWVNLRSETALTSVLKVGMGGVGTYRCVISDAFEREVVSEPATLTVQETDSDYEADAPFDFPANLNVPFYVPGADESRRKRSWPLPGNNTDDSYGFDLGVDAVGTKVTVDNPTGSLVRVIFHGPCNKPYVSIAGNVYKVNASAVNGESIVIDPLARNKCKVGSIVYRVDRSGYVTNLYPYRERGHDGSGTYVFRRIPYGEYYVGWPQDITVDLDIIDERGMPPWSS